jgi:hypothetical protein
LESFSSKLDRLRADFLDEDKNVFSLYCYMKKSPTGKYTMADLQSIVGDSIKFFTIEAGKK